MARLALLGLALLAACAPAEARRSGDRTPEPPALAIAITRPSNAPSNAPSKAPRSTSSARSLRVLVGGDLIPHRPSLVAPESIRRALAPLVPVFAAADAVVANYETATGEAGEDTFRLAYAAPPAWIAELPRAGVSAITVANNHACDLGRRGLAATLEAAAERELITIGADEDDPWQPRVLVEDGGDRVCAVAWTTLSNADGACAHGERLAFADASRAGRARVRRALSRAREACDATVAIFHGGTEYAPQTDEVLAQARAAADAGADAVVVHHPHVASPIVVHETPDGRRVPIFASVGNLVSNQGQSWKLPMYPVLRDNRRLVCVNGWTRLGVLADLAFTFERESVRLDWGAHLVWGENEHAFDRAVRVPEIRARVLDPVADRAIIERLSDDPEGPVALFEEPCWLERDALAGPTSARSGHARCTATRHDRARRR